MFEPDQVDIETPEQVELQLEPAGLGSRFTAWVVDTVLKALIVVAVLIVIAITGALRSMGAEGLGILAAFLQFFFGFIYDTSFEARRNGQTPGKKFQRMRVIR